MCEIIQFPKPPGEPPQAAEPCSRCASAHEQMVELEEENLNLRDVIASLAILVVTLQQKAGIVTL